MEALMGTDIEGIISELNLPETDVLFPFFESIVNSIQSITERGADIKGKISVEIFRDKSNQELFDNNNQYPISSIKIIDNGIGFNTSNFNSFFKAHSTKKIKIGGKGIGRFTMLSVFNSIDISSIYDEGGIRFKKTFSLSRKKETKDPIIEETTNEIKTEIILSNIESKFINETAKFNHEEIADSILEHCLLYYLNTNVPDILIIENNTIINLSRQFNPHDFIKHQFTKPILGFDFTCYFIKNEKIKSHQYSLCGHNRVVKNKRIDTFFPVFSSKVYEENNEYFIQIYVVSKYLDSKVNMSRNEINFPKIDKEENSDCDAMEFDIDTRKVIIEKDIDDFIKDAIGNKYSLIIEERKENIKIKLSKYLGSDEGLEYRYLELEDSFLINIPDTADNKKLDDILHDYQYKKGKEIRKKREKLLSKSFSKRKDYQELLKEVVSSTTKEGNSRLAQYVAHRKTIIDLLEKYLEWSEDTNNYKEEQLLHNLIFIMGGTQDTISYNEHNLWLLDDRLSFHKYIYSDKAIKTHKPTAKDKGSKKETDIAIYDKGYIYGEQIDYGIIASAVVFEFKRPDRGITYEEFS
ncbi:MAG: ATP-binding protein [Paludibacter sp.]